MLGYIYPDYTAKKIVSHDRSFESMPQRYDFKGKAGHCDNYNLCDEKTAILTCCLSISQRENPAHSCIWTFRQRPKHRIPTTSFCLAFLGQLLK